MNKIFIILIAVLIGCTKKENHSFSAEYLRNDCSNNNLTMYFNVQNSALVKYAAVISADGTKILPMELKDGIQSVKDTIQNNPYRHAKYYIYVRFERGIAQEQNSFFVFF
jgi:hypothetical protein